LHTDLLKWVRLGKRSNWISLFISLSSLLLGFMGYCNFGYGLEHFDFDSKLQVYFSPSFGSRCIKNRPFNDFAGFDRCDYRFQFVLQLTLYLKSILWLNDMEDASSLWLTFLVKHNVDWQIRVDF